MTHGRTGYDRHGCRCEVCTAANTEHVRRVRERRKARLLASPAPESDPGHGTIGGYDAGCRCEACRLIRQVRHWRSSGAPRRHYWREYVTEVYRAARDAWEALRESSTPLPSRTVTGGSGAVISAYQLETEEFARVHPPPTFKGFLIQLKDSLKNDLTQHASVA